ncbi:hypothetical protein LTR36_009022 [Oleoguttula mirabilis]|uniref:Uncharacterized protein n=1 Tax=Oleoguttula mirabilis TaxID=1507867 RepID=A0AAV9J7L5_9PEZI|nr:hypothetical protein LTR36_009022 [Oleoguttula mirabilis]
MSVYKKECKKGQLGLMLPEDAPTALTHAPEIGIFAAYLLAEEDTTKHNRRKYVLNGLKDLTGKDLVKLVKARIGTGIDDIEYLSFTVLESMVANTPYSKNVISTISHALNVTLEGKATNVTTSKEFYEIAPPLADEVKAMLE